MAAASHALAGQLAGEPVGAALGAHEHERAPAAAGDGRRHLDLVHLVDRQEAVGHLLDGDLRRRDLVEDRIVLVAPDERVDHAVEGGREQQRLVPPVDVAEDPLDLGQEAHVGHAVGLVDDDVVDVGHRELALLDQVDEPARAWRRRRRRPSRSALIWRVHAGAAVDGVRPARRGPRPAAPARRAPAGPAPGSGTSTMADGPAGLRPCARRSRTGRPKASVLPEPVLALPQTSRPARASGIVRAWIGKGLVMPRAASASQRSVGTPRAPNPSPPAACVAVPAGVSIDVKLLLFLVEWHVLGVARTPTQRTTPSTRTGQQRKPTCGRRRRQIRRQVASPYSTPPATC